MVPISRVIVPKRHPIKMTNQRMRILRLRAPASPLGTMRNRVVAQARSQTMGSVNRRKERSIGYNVLGLGYDLSYDLSIY